MTRHMLRDKVFGLVFRIEFYPENELDEQVKFFEEYAGEEEYLPWDVIDDGVTKAHLLRELHLAREGKNNLVKVSVKDDMMTITSRSEEGDVREELAVDKEGNDIEIGFNSKYVMDVIKEIADETVTLNMKSSVTPCVVRPVEGNAYEYLILPVRIPSM